MTREVIEAVLEVIGTDVVLRGDPADSSTWPLVSLELDPRNWRRCNEWRFYYRSRQFGPLLIETTS